MASNSSQGSLTRPDLQQDIVRLVGVPLEPRHAAPDNLHGIHTAFTGTNLCMTTYLEKDPLVFRVRLNPLRLVEVCLSAHLVRRVQMVLVCGSTPPGIQDVRCNGLY